jgi:YHS domain-containing protein
MSDRKVRDCEYCGKTVRGPEEAFKTAEVDGETLYFCGVECKTRWSDNKRGN